MHSGNNRYSHIRKSISGGAKHAYGPMHPLFNRMERKLEDQPSVPKHKTKKDTKKWCKGKVGLTHEFKSKPYHVVTGLSFMKDSHWIIDVCINCGKRTSMRHNLNIKCDIGWHRL